MQHGDQHHLRVARFLEHIRSSRAVACSSIWLIVAQRVHVARAQQQRPPGMRHLPPLAIVVPCAETHDHAVELRARGQANEADPAADVRLERRRWPSWTRGPPGKDRTNSTLDRPRRHPTLERLTAKPITPLTAYLPHMTVQLKREAADCAADHSLAQKGRRTVIAAEAVMVAERELCINDKA